MMATIRNARRTTLVRALTALVLVVPLLVVRGAPAVPLVRSETSSALGRVPTALLPEMNADLASDDPAYAVTPLPGASFQAANPNQRMTATFAPDGVTIGARDGAAWRFRFTGIGDGETFAPARETAPTANHVRIEYRRENLTEWYVNGPVGIEQGFTLATPPTGSDTVTLALAVAGAIPTPTGDDVLLTLPGGTTQRYRGLVATDARGKQLPARLAVTDDTIRIVVTTTGAMWPVTVDPFVEANALIASDPAATDNLGFSVAVNSNGSVVVGGAQHKTVSGHASQGAVYVWHLPTLTPIKLTASDGAASDAFGHSVSVSADGSIVAVGAFNKSVGGRAGQGQAYVYSGTNYGTETKVICNDHVAGDQFGSGVSLDSTGTSLAVGAPGVNSEGEVFLRSGLNYNTETPVVSSDNTIGNLDGFGTAVALSGDGGTLVAGAPNFNVGGSDTAGKIYIYTIPGLAVVGKTASDFGTADNLGSSVAVSGNGALVVAGAPDQTGGAGANQGAAYIFSGASHGTQTKLNDPTPAASDFFGYAVAVSGNGTTIAIGTFNKNAVYAFANTGAPLQTVIGTAPNGTHFGDSVALSADGGTLAAGAPSEAAPGPISQAGKVHVFTQQVPASLPPTQPHGPIGSGPAPLPSPPQPKGLPGGSPNPLPTRRP